MIVALLSIPQGESTRSFDSIDVLGAVKSFATHNCQKEAKG